MLAFAVVLSIWPFGAHAALIRDHGVVEHWRYDLVQDRFLNSSACSLRRGQIEVVNGFVKFRLGKSTDTAEAYYKIDAGPARPWRNIIPTLVAAGLKVQDDSLANPSGGVVTLPLEAIASAHEIQIRPTNSSSPRTFLVDSIALAIEDARKLGCDVHGSRGS